MRAVAEAEEAGFLAIQIGLDHDFRAGGAKGAVKTAVDGGKRLVERHRHGHALAGGKTVGLDDDRRTLLANIGLCRFGGSLKR